ncbi:aminopeptidase [Patescibacteria group bacterium]|nr:aminopeptidase [Patescibacteria group bacterium]
MNKEILEKYADVLMWGLKEARKTTGEGAEYQKGDIIHITCYLRAMKLAEILQGKILKEGMFPVVDLVKPASMELNFYKKAINDEQLSFLAPGKKELYKKLNGRIVLWAPESLTHLKKIDPQKLNQTDKVVGALREIAQKRELEGLLGWTLCLIPTPATAKQAKMTLKDYTDEVIKSCYLDTANPVGKWMQLAQEIKELKRWLNQLTEKTDRFHIVSKNTDLWITPGEKRQWVGVSGHNIPSFELFISPNWRGTEGTYFADQPSFRKGNYIEKVSLIFKKGRAVEIKAEKGKKFTIGQLTMDKGASQVGEFSLTDKRFSPIGKFMANTLFDENVGQPNGNCHIAVGDSYPDTYSGDPKMLTKKMQRELGFNESDLHWDLVNTEDKTVTAHRKSGESLIIYENGMFRH